MKHWNAIVIGLISFVVLVLLVYPFSSHRPTCGDGVCIKTQVEEPIRANEPLTVLVEVSTERDIPNLEISLSASSGSVIPETSTPTSAANTMQAQAFADEGRAHWLIHAEAGVPIIVSGTIPITSSVQIIDVVASANTSNGSIANRVHVDLTQPAQPVQQVNTPIPVAPYPGPSSVPYPTPRPPTAAPSTAIAPTMKPGATVSTPPSPGTGIAVTKTPNPASTKPQPPTVSKGTVIVSTPLATPAPATAIAPTPIKVFPPPTAVPKPTIRPPTLVKPTVPPYP